MTSPLVTTNWLAEHLDDPTVRVIEVSQTPELTLYNEGHVPGAIGVFWKDLCWHKTDREFITPDALAEMLGSMGIDNDHTLVIYGDPVQYGTYAFWALTMAGHTNLRCVDGGRKKWVNENRPMTQATPTFTPTTFTPGSADESMRIGRNDVRDHLGDNGRFLLDVRSPEEYSGERVMEHGKFDHGAERGGRIPGATHLFFRNLLNDDDTYKSPDELKKILSDVGATPEQGGEIVVYCRLSHRATLTWVAMKYLLGFDDAKIYDGSWTEWGSIVGFPVER